MIFIFVLQGNKYMKCTLHLKVVWEGSGLESWARRNAPPFLSSSAGRSFSPSVIFSPWILLRRGCCIVLSFQIRPAGLSENFLPLITALRSKKKSLCKMVQVSTRAFLILKSDLFRPCWFDQERQTTLLEQEKKEIHRWEWKTHVRWNIPPFEIRSDWFKRHYNENFFSSQCWWWEKRATIIHLSIIGDFFSDCTLLYSQQLPFHTSN